MRQAQLGIAFMQMEKTGSSTLHSHVGACTSLQTD